MPDRSTPGGTVLPVEFSRVSRTEALRRAISALGYRAPVSAILAYVHEHFGIGEAAPGATAAPATPPQPEGLAQSQGKAAASNRGKRKG